MSTAPRLGHLPVPDPQTPLPPGAPLVPRPVTHLPFTSYPNQPPVGPAEALLREALERVLALAELWEETEPDAPHTVALWEALG
ncbi:hypothetical protein [Kitasatospora sp. NPDC057015]|uniref:hypothetical protein n=1 Tax=Kitasatospora sp. NPDC057015 TaxID=3346001 RepID=UPI00363E4FEE